jgi:hypothetical protein
MNRKKYMGDTRYERVLITMDLLGITDVTTNKQHKNGTIVWKLPIKNNNSGKTNIEVASFSTGYVRNQNSGYSNYQLNKRCEGEPEYYPEHKYNSISGMHDKTGKYIKYTTRSCKLIPIEIDRLEYLISYCLKNYFIKRANQVVEGKYVSQWYHDYMMKRQPNNADQQFKLNELQNKLANSVPKWKYDEAMNLGHTQDEEVIDLKAHLSMERNRINDLEEKVYAMTEDRDCKSDRVTNLSLQNEVLQNKLATINRISE